MRLGNNKASEGMRSRSLKAVLMGESTVGKTSIVNVANTGEFTDGFRPTVGAFFLTNRYIFDNVSCTLNIWDTAGQERYRALAPMYFRDMNMACIIYAIDSRQSFEAVENWYRAIADEMQNIPTLYLIGNKKDLLDQRAVSLEEGSELAEKLGATFFEVSAKSDRREISEIFEKMARDAVSKLSSSAETRENTFTHINPEQKDGGCC